MTPDLRALTPADRYQVLTALTAVIDRELAAVAVAADAAWWARGIPADMREWLTDRLVADLRGQWLALVRELVAPRYLH